MPLSPPRCAKSRRHRAGNALCIPRRKVQQYRCIKKRFLLDALIMILMGRVALIMHAQFNNVKSKSARAEAKLKITSSLAIEMGFPHNLISTVNHLQSV
jgi:hypothetical protein